jgi:hypothetical protein
MTVGSPGVPRLVPNLAPIDGREEHTVEPWRASVLDVTYARAYRGALACLSA